MSLSCKVRRSRQAGRHAALAVAAALALAGCRSTEVSPGRERAVGHGFRCDQTAAVPGRVRAIFAAAGLQLREQGDAESLWIAAAERRDAEYLIQIVGPDATAALYVPRGASPSADEVDLLERLSATFEGCRREPDPTR